MSSNVITEIPKIQHFKLQIDPSIALAKITLKGTKNNSFVPSKDPAPVHDNSFQNQTTLYEINNPITKNLPKSTENKMPSKNQTRRTDKVLNTLIPKNVSSKQSLATHSQLHVFSNNNDCCNTLICYPCPIPYNFLQVPVIVPARTYFEPVIHDHPPLEVMKKIMNKNKKNYTEYNYDDSSSVTDSGSEIDTSADY